MFVDAALLGTRLGFLGGRYSAVPCAARADLVIREFAFSAGTGPQLIKQVTRARMCVTSTGGALEASEADSRPPDSGGSGRGLRRGQRFLNGPCQRVGPCSDYEESPDGECARRHHPSTARAGASAQMKPSHTGTPKALATTSPITTPADGSSQKYRYGTALAAHQAGRPGSTLLIARDRRVVGHRVDARKPTAAAVALGERTRASGRNLRHRRPQLERSRSS